MSFPSADAANHHASYPGFAGATGLLAGLTMIVGRGGMARLAADLASVSSADRVVDIGCGPGSAVREAARRGSRVTGVDPAPVMLWLARKLTRDQPGITWAEAAAEDLGLAGGSATVVWSLATVHHWHDLDAGLAEAKRVLVPGGRLLAIERQVRPGARGLASHGWTEHQAADFADHTRAAGFVGVQVGSERSGRRAVQVVIASRP
jgi:ubiquinone/menaquinone biosynthesis C-methylase UbiE